MAQNMEKAISIKLMDHQKLKAHSEFVHQIADYPDKILPRHPRLF